MRRHVWKFKKSVGIESCRHSFSHKSRVCLYAKPVFMYTDTQRKYVCRSLQGKMGVEKC